MVVKRQTQTSTDMLQDATIDDCWITIGDKSLSEPRIGVTRSALLNKDPPERDMWVRGRLTKKQVTPRPGNMWPERRSRMSKNSVRKAINTCQEETPELDAAREERGTPLPDDDPDHEEIMNSATRKTETRTASAMPCKITKTSQPERFKLGATRHK